MTGFTQKKINVRFVMGEGDFGEGGFNTLELEGLRVQCQVVRGGGNFMSELNMRIFGMSLSDMNRLVILGKPLTVARRNSITVFAGDDQTGLSVAFTGTILTCYLDANGAPDISLVVSASAGYMSAIKPVAPVSYNGSIDVATAVAGIAAQMTPEGAQPDEDGNIGNGLIFENNGVNVVLKNTYLSGTLLTQLQDLAKAADFEYIIDNDTLAIWTKGGARKGLTPLISAETGMIGYPAYTENGISLSTIYNPSVVFATPINVQSEFIPANLNGMWVPYNVMHELDTESAQGRWMTTMECNLEGQATVAR